MPRFRANLRAFKFDKKGYLKKFEREMTQQNYRAAGAWLEAVIERIPVRTGMARASLLPLARFLALRHASDREIFDIHPIQSPDRIEEGQESAQDPASLFKSTGNGEFLFQYNITVLHYLLNEFAEFGMGPYKNPADPAIQPPWESLQLGLIAYTSYIKAYVSKNIPRVAQFIYATKITRPEVE